jgi:uncharacterized protein (DUF2344 family)
MDLSEKVQNQWKIHLNTSRKNKIVNIPNSNRLFCLKILKIIKLIDKK